jgi:hypothetical protein
MLLKTIAEQQTKLFVCRKMARLFERKYKKMPSNGIHKPVRDGYKKGIPSMAHLLRNNNEEGTDY